MQFRGNYWFLSNFSPSPLSIQGVMYPTVEHAFQAAKTEDTGERERIARLSTPAEAKRAGRTVRLRADWNKVRVTVMYRLLKLKFQDPGLRSRLLATGDLPLVEDNQWHDGFWGNCTCGRCPQGQNILGQLLMRVRDEARE